MFFFLCTCIPVKTSGSVWHVLALAGFRRTVIFQELVVWSCSFIFILMCFFWQPELVHEPRGVAFKPIFSGLLLAATASATLPSQCTSTIFRLSITLFIAMQLHYLIGFLWFCRIYLKRLSVISEDQPIRCSNGPTLHRSLPCSNQHLSAAQCSSIFALPITWLSNFLTLATA